MKFNNIFSTSNVRDAEQLLNSVEPVQNNVELSEEELQSVNGGYHRHFRHHRHHGHGWGWGWGWGDGCWGDDDCDGGGSDGDF